MLHPVVVPEILAGVWMSQGRSLNNVNCSSILFSQVLNALLEPQARAPPHNVLDL